MLLSSAGGRSGPLSWLPTPRFGGGALDVLRVMREINPAEVQAEIDAALRLVVCATSRDDATQLSEDLFRPADASGEPVLARAVEDGAPADTSPDLVLIRVRPGESPWGLLEAWQAASSAGAPWAPTVLLTEVDPVPLPDSPARRDAEPAILVTVVDGQPAAVAQALVPALQELLPRKLLAFGRRFPLFRPAISDLLIRETSRANAEFALVSSLPANIPLVGGLLGSAADLVMLTKNQALLVYKLAGLHGRDLDDRLALTAEIAPVVGGAFAWRTLARSLLGLVPGVIAGLPKAAVAFAGTFVVGQLAHYYYATGRRPTAEQAARLQAQAVQLARDLVERLARWRPSKPR